MKGFPVKTPLRPFVEVKLEDGEDFISSYPYNYIKNFSVEIGKGSELELEMYDADGAISNEIIAATNDSGGRFASGKKIEVRWGWIEGRARIESRLHKFTINQIKTRWEPNTGFVFTIQGRPFTTNSKRNLMGSYSDKPNKAIEKLMKEAFGDKNKLTIDIEYIKNGEVVSGDSFFANEKVTAEGESKDWETILKKILLKCKIESGEAIYYHLNSYSNTLIICDIATNKKDINEDFFDSKPFEFGRLISGSKSYLTEFETELDNVFMDLSSGINSQNITSKMSNQEESDIENQNTGISNDKNIGKTEDSKGSGTEAIEGKLGSEPSKLPDTPESKTSINVSSSNPQPDDSDLVGREPQELTQATTQQIQRQFNRLGGQVSATFIGNPLWDDINYITGASLSFDVYSPKPGKAGQSFNKILSLKTQAYTVIHSIQGGQYFCTFPDMTTQQA